MPKLQENKVYDNSNTCIFLLADRTFSEQNDKKENCMFARTIARVKTWARSDGVLGLCDGHISIRLRLQFSGFIWINMHGDASCDLEDRSGDMTVDRRRSRRTSLLEGLRNSTSDCNSISIKINT